MSTNKLYYNSAYKKLFLAKVLSCVKEDGFIIVLDQTLFYPEGGGQPADKGTLSNKKVLHVYEKEEVVYHILDEPLAEGTIVTGAIDWEFRYDLMRQHTAEHIVSGLANHIWGYNNVGFHMGADYTTLDLDGKLSPENLEKLEDLANRAVALNNAVVAYYPDEKELSDLKYRSKKQLEGLVRIVEIPDADLCACCGLHTAYTAEVGIIKLLSCQSYKGGVRISMVAGERAFLDYHKKCENIQQISNLLSVPQYDCARAVIALKEERDSLKWQLLQQGREIFKARLLQLKPDTTKAIFFETNMDSKEVRHCINMALERVSGYVAIFSGDNESYSFMIGGNEEVIKALADKLKETFDCKAGGSKGFIQGKIFAKRQALEEFFNVTY